MPKPIIFTDEVEPLPEPDGLFVVCHIDNVTWPKDKPVPAKDATFLVARRSVGVMTHEFINRTQDVVEPRDVALPRAEAEALLAECQRQYGSSWSHTFNVHPLEDFT